MNRNVMVGSVLAAAALIATSSFASGFSFTGLFKAFDKTLAPGEQYTHNITVRKYYNVSIRFQKENSTSYLSFDDSGSVIVLKDAAGNEIANATGVKNGRAYIKMDNIQVASVAKVYAYNISSYADVVAQPVNDTVLSSSGTTAYLTVKVHYPSASISGYVADDLTGELVAGVTVAAFEDGADVSTAMSIKQSVSDASGKYAMSFDLADSKAMDVYVEGYDVA
jgi:voltage-gated potassium channel Kch